MRWHQSLLSILRVTVITKGSIGSLTTLHAPRLIAANHISWLDIHVLASQAPLVFVAKSEVMSWPLFGTFAKSVGTIFLNRNQASDIKRVLTEIAVSFTKKELICIFPEGTSSAGKSIQYQRHKHFTEAPAYYGDMSLIKSILNVLKNPGMTAVIQVLPEITGSLSRQALSAQVFNELNQASSN
jgi:1-acyl-sn-glycerol-3-phosphate acyltransferase